MQRCYRDLMTIYPTANKIDVLMGCVMRDARLAKGITQKELADAAGISFQQIQKYETGSNRISISRLFQLSRVIGFKASDLVIAVEAMSGGDGKPSKSASSVASLTESEIGQRALQSLSTIDDHVVLDTVTTLLELFNRKPEADRFKESSSNDDD